MAKQTGQKTPRVFNWGAILSVSLLVTLALALFILMRQESQKTDFDQYLTLTAEQQVLAHAIDKHAVAAGTGAESAFAKLRAARDRGTQIVTALTEGDAEAALPPSPAAIQPKLEQMRAAWNALSVHVDAILSGESVLVNADRILKNIENLLPQIRNIVQAQSLKWGGSESAQQVDQASQQLLLVQQLQLDVVKVRQAGRGAQQALTALSNNTDALINRVSQLSSQDEEQTDSSEAAENLQTQLTALSGYRDEVLAMSDALLPAMNAMASSTDQRSAASTTRRLSLAVDDVVTVDQALAALYRSGARTVQIGELQLDPKVALLLFAVAAVLLMLLIFVFIMQRNRASQGAIEYSRNQAAIRQLLKEMRGLGDGDLSIEATVTDDITGAIADSVNLAVESMRGVVSSINETANNVSDATRKSQYLSAELTNAAKVQVRDISQASEVGESMGVALEDMADKAKRLANITIDSYELAGQGGRAVNQNVEAMGDLREQIQGTSKRIKRLGESSQEIGSIVGLIMGITDQTNILAMNASMQAATAGEAGRGFSLVADELQRLAERSARATKQIETLINTIQADTSEAVSSMESSISNVLNGERLTEKAGSILEKIEAASREVTDSAKDMSNTAEAQSNKAATLRDTMLSVREITDRMSDDISMTSKGTLFLARNVLQLQKSVAEFKLPQQSEVESAMEDATQETDVDAAHTADANTESHS